MSGATKAEREAWATRYLGDVRTEVSTTVATATTAWCREHKVRVLRLNQSADTGPAYCVLCDFWYLMPSPAVEIRAAVSS